MWFTQWTTWAWLYWNVLWRVYHKIVLRAIIGHFKSVEKRVGSVVKRKEKVLQYSDSERMFGIFIKYALYLCVNGKCASRRVMKIHAGHVSAASPCITYISLSLLGWRGRGGGAHDCYIDWQPAVWYNAVQSLNILVKLELFCIS